MTARVLYVSNFLSATQNRGYCEDLADRLEARGRTVLRTSTRPQRLARIADMLATCWTRRADYDVALVDVFSGPAFVWAESVCFALRRLNKPYVLTLHGGNLPVFAREWPRRTRRLLASAALVTAPSEYLRSTMRPYRDEIVLVRNAIDTQPFVVVGGPRTGSNLLWVRAMHAIYNPLLAIEVLAAIAKHDPNATLTMLGPDKHDGSRTAVEHRVTELGIGEHVTLVGPVPKQQVAAYLTRADVFINTTNIDNTPLSVLEAMAAGTPVVSTAVGGIPFLLEHERTALLVPPNDASAMTAAVRRILTDRHLARRLSDNARTVAFECDWSRVLERWDRAFEQVSV